MKQELIKINEGHYIYVNVDFSEIKESDYVFDTYANINSIQRVRRCDFNSTHYKNGNWFKITHSFGKHLDGVENRPLSEVELINGKLTLKQ